MRFFLLFLLFGNVLASSAFVQVSPDTAGHDANIRITGLQIEELVQVDLTKPDNSVLRLEFSASQEGVVSDQIYGLHLRESGEYRTQLVRPSLGDQKVRESFVVSPGAVSAYRSEIETSRLSAAADGSETIEIIMKLRDAYDNPVSDQGVQLISSRSEDSVVLSTKSDDLGIARARITTDTPGVSVFSIVVDDIVLLERPELIWHPAAKGLLNVGQSDVGGLGSFLKAQLFDDDFFQAAAYFTVEDLPGELIAGRNYTFRVEAKDPDANTVKDYDGRVRFSSSDAQAQLPADYRYEAIDQGVHTFALAINFATPGPQTLTVTDLTDSSIVGTIEVEVVDANGNTNAGDLNQGVTILTPSEGTYRTSRVTITGTAPRNTLLRIVDGPTVLIEDLVTDSSGEFVYQTPALADGLHKFIVSSVDGSLVSQEVPIRVDQTPPRVLTVELDPSTGIEPSSVFQVAVSSNETLSSATCTFNGISTDLNPAGDRFGGTFQAPGTCGEYPMSCTVADILGNELVEPNAAVVTVCGGPAPVVEDQPASIAIPDQPTTVSVPPTAVDNLSAEPGDRQVTLYWSPATDDQGVTAYQVDYGTDPKNLYLQNITPDNRTQWYVDGLKEGTKYFFTVRALDFEGNGSAVGTPVEATTFGEVLRSSAVPTSGAKLWLPIVLALSFGFFFLGISFRKQV